MNRQGLVRFAWLAIAAALVTIALKATAYLLSGSVGLLSDALESLVNLIAAMIALLTLTVAARPPDEEHAFGHGKAEYFSSEVEGMLILLAAVSIGVVAVQRLINPRPLEQVGLGLVISGVALLVNLGVALILRRVGREHDSITLEAHAQHLFTDVWTSAGVIAGVAATAFTGLTQLDALIALMVAANVLWSGVRIVQRSVRGLMDTALAGDEQALVQAVLDRYRQNGVQFHALLTRQAGARRFVSLHVLVPGRWTVQRGHQLLERIEADIRRALPSVTVFTHLESLDDPSSWQDTTIDRPEGGAAAEKPAQNG